jgi:hypothetical protein
VDGSDCGLIYITVINDTVLDELRKMKILVKLSVFRMRYE